MQKQPLRNLLNVICAQSVCKIDMYCSASAPLAETLVRQPMRLPYSLNRLALSN